MADPNNDEVIIELTDIVEEGSEDDAESPLSADGDDSGFEDELENLFADDEDDDPLAGLGDDDLAGLGGAPAPGKAAEPEADGLGDLGELGELGGDDLDFSAALGGAEGGEEDGDELPDLDGLLGDEDTAAAAPAAPEAAKADDLGDLEGLLGDEDTPAPAAEPEGVEPGNFGDLGDLGDGLDFSAALGDDEEEAAAAPAADDDEEGLPDLDDLLADDTPAAADAAAQPEPEPESEPAAAPKKRKKGPFDDEELPAEDELDLHGLDELVDELDLPMAQISGGRGAAKGEPADLDDLLDGLDEPASVEAAAPETGDEPDELADLEALVEPEAPAEPDAAAEVEVPAEDEPLEFPEEETAEAAEAAPAETAEEPAEEAPSEAPAEELAPEAAAEPQDEDIDDLLQGLDDLEEAAEAETDGDSAPEPAAAAGNAAEADDEDEDILAALDALDAAPAASAPTAPAAAAPEPETDFDADFDKDDDFGMNTADVDDILAELEGGVPDAPVSEIPEHGSATAIPDVDDILATLDEEVPGLDDGLPSPASEYMGEVATVAPAAVARPANARPTDTALLGRIDALESKLARMERLLTAALGEDAAAELAASDEETSALLEGLARDAVQTGDWSGFISAVRDEIRAQVEKATPAAAARILREEIAALANELP
ncbi:MAG: hypothetical protein H0S85_16930 [Desulfovibrionaceae bacterium]|jgi:hypothetical protein|nr:hypothetical protein [Desulfovibrionaceae bacterium]